MHWPAKIDVKAETDRLAKELSLKYGRWLVEAPALEDVTQLSQDVARELKKMGAVSDVATALDLKESSLKSFWNDTAEFFGGKHKTLAGELLQAVSEERTRLWKERVHEINWELFDRGTESFTWYAIEELTERRKTASLVSGAPNAKQTEAFITAGFRSATRKAVRFGMPLSPFIAIREDLEKPFRDKCILLAQAIWPERRFGRRRNGPRAPSARLEQHLYAADHQSD